MEERKYCICCSGEIRMNFGLLYKEMICPHCSALIKYRKNLLGQKIIEARYPGENVYQRITMLGRSKED